jgi:chromosome segregation ATPase
MNSNESANIETSTVMMKHTPEVIHKSKTMNASSTVKSTAQSSGVCSLHKTIREHRANSALTAGGNHTKQLLARLQHLQKDLRRAKTQQDRERDTLVDKNDMLETQLWRIQDSVATKSLKAIALDESNTLTESALKELTSTVNHFASKLDHAEKTILEQHNLISALNSQHEAIYHVIDEQACDMRNLRVDSGKLSKVMKHLTSIGEVMNGE